MVDTCPKCGRENMFPYRDEIYNIDYQMCFNCGKVVFMNDGLGQLRYKVPKVKKFRNTCTICGKKFTSNSKKNRRCDDCEKGNN